MKMSKNVKKIAVIVLLLLICFFLYRTFAPKNAPKSTPISKNGLSSGTTTDTLPIAQKESIEKLLNLLLSINSISLSNDIFTKKEFKSLVDYSITEEEQQLEESTGRNNPFLPIGVELGGSARTGAYGIINTAPNYTGLPTDQNNTTRNSGSTSSGTGLGVGASQNTGSVTTPGNILVPIPNPIPTPNL